MLTSVLKHLLYVPVRILWCLLFSYVGFEPNKDFFQFTLRYKSLGYDESLMNNSFALNLDDKIL